MIDSSIEHKRGSLLAVKILAGLFVVLVLLFIVLAARQLGILSSRRANISGLGKAMLIYANDYEDELPRSGGRNCTWVEDASKLKQIEVNHRKPQNDKELKYWLENMVWFHRFSDKEISTATGLAIAEIASAKRRFNIRHDNRPKLLENKLLVLPYPGGRHPRVGFLEGAINPQRETKFSVFTPWDPNDYAVVDLPEAIWSNLGLTYLAHTHVDTIWTKQEIRLKPLEWNRGTNGILDFERVLPNKITFGAKVRPTGQAVFMEFWLKNGTPDRLSDLRVQICVMPKMAEGFEQQTNENKIFKKPYTACRSTDGTRWMIVAWTNCDRTWANPDCPCFHSDPKFPDTEPGQTQTLYGWFSFYEGMDIEAELERIESTGWRKTDHADDDNETSVSDK